MFASHPFGQSSSSLFSSQSMFGQTSTSAINSFAPKPFRTTNSFGSPTQTTIFGGMSTGVFGQPSTSAFGASSAPAFGSSTPSSGASSTPAFGSSPFGGSSLYSHKPAFRSFGSSPSQSSPFGSTFQQTRPAFGSNLFGSVSQFSTSTQPAFGSTTTSAFGSVSTPSFGATTTPSFGTTSPASGTSSTPAFGSTMTLVFGALSNPAFGSTTTPAFGSTSTSPFGNTGSSFGVSSFPAFGSIPTASFGTSSTPAFGSLSTPAFGASTAPTFGSPTVSAFGAMSSHSFSFGSTPSFGQSASTFGSTPFGASPSPFSVHSSPFGANATAPTFSSTSFGQPALWSQTGGTRVSPYSPTTELDGGSSNQSFGKLESVSAIPVYKDKSHEELRWEDYQHGDKGANATAPTFGSTSFGQPALWSQTGGTRVSPYSPTPELDGGSSNQSFGKLESVSAIPVYKDKSHEELRWEDYQHGDKGGPKPFGQPATPANLAASSQPSLFGCTAIFSQSVANPFSSSSSDPFALKSPSFGSSAFGSASTSLFSSPFSTTPSNPFGSNSSTSSPFGALTGSSCSAISSSPAFGGLTTSAFGSSTSLFGSSIAGSGMGFGTDLAFGNSQSSGLFQSKAAPFGQTSSLFGRTSTGFQHATSTFESSLFSNQSSAFGGSLFSNSTPSLFPSSTPAEFSPTATSFQVATATQISTFSFTNLGQTSPASPSRSTSYIFGQGVLGQIAAGQPNMATQPSPITNPFGALPPMPQISIGSGGSTNSIQYGISSLPVADKLIQVRTSSLLVPRYTSLRRRKIVRQPPRRYSTETDGSRVHFTAADEDIPSISKADALFILRENPRSLIIHPIEPWHPRSSLEKDSISKDRLTTASENVNETQGPPDPDFEELYACDNDECRAENGNTTEQTDMTASPSVPSHSRKENDGDHRQKETDSIVKESSFRASHSSVVFKDGKETDVLLPKLQHADYYTIPSMEELAAKERAEPGFCRSVRDFVVGRREFGSIKFIGETDVRQLDLESIIQFNYGVVNVYGDESTKPPVGQGLNKPAEITLNIKCTDKKTGKEYTEGPRVEKYKERLILRGNEQGVEFVSFDPIEGEWKFKVQHFSCYSFLLG